MNVWSKLLTAMRGGAQEAGEALVDSQALRILDQEIRDADAELHRSREALANIMAKQKLAADKLSKVSARIAEYEQYALKALESGNETLAREVAEKIAGLENEAKLESEQAEAYATSVANLRQAVQQAEGNIKRLKQQVDVVKATESVQKAQLAVSQRYGGSQAKMHTALESLERIKQKQAERGARMEAAAELAVEGSPDQALEEKLRAAGITPASGSADSVLERLKQRSDS
ncbi:MULTISPECIES: PspA/IM30 family protein [Pseudomonadaceae]|jgi:phage shock protein A|uniref:Phage shock protein A n=2 Tax=Pseudomonas abyssi TaxID=170540 RepID=A0ACD6B4N6_9PSED|nr:MULTISPECIES: PspA/IM30 family protein [Pseudomonadaceae]MAG68137.1 phage shock protein A [Pseudomonadales bacterium]PBK06003.1 phage shock protein A [Pseudomonas abyssi]RGP54514.1 phage shock protein A [Halopseudomonas gallaeciensis]|tara:strand:+ start:6782 stop:7477 length:696 start_codon:yes stop_codon:yes gene_type:complete